MGATFQGTIFLGGNFPGGVIFREAIIQGTIDRGPIIHGAIFLEGNCPDTIHLTRKTALK